MSVSFEEIGRLAATFMQSNCTSGQVCKIGGDGKVVPCAAGDKFCGIVEAVRGNFAGVQLEGFAEVSFTGSVSTGYVSLCADGSGGIKAGTGREYLVVQTNTNTGIAIIKL